MEELTDKPYQLDTLQYFYLQFVESAKRGIISMAEYMLGANEGDSE